MSEPVQPPVSEASREEKHARRAFLQRAGKTSAAAPAVALLMSANFSNAQTAPSQYGNGGTGGTGSGSS